jgi:hypothetical protein
MAQSMAGAGMQQGQQGAPIAQQVMQQAAQESQGLEALPSNLPQEYAGGGIIAFEDGGQVERYQNAGYTGDPMGMGGSEITDYAGTGDPYVGKNLLETLTFAPDDPEWKRKLKLEEALRAREKALGVKPPVAPMPTPAAVPPTAKVPAAPAAPAPPAAPRIPSGSGFKMPTLPTMQETPAPTLTNYDTLIGDMPKKTKEASEAAVKASQAELEGFDRPGFEAREGRLGKREAAQEKDAAMNRALNLIGVGFDIAGSSERTVAGAVSKSKGIQNLIQGEAANRAAKERLEDARDNFEQQKVQAKKGNYQAAQQAGNRAADDLRAGTQLTMTGAHYGNTESLQRTQLQQQGNFQKASLGQAGILGLAELGLKKEQLNQQAASTNAQLQLGRERLDILKGQIAAGDKRAAAALATAEQKAYAAFQGSSDYRIAQEKAKKMPSHEAQRYMQQEWLKYSENAMPSLLAGQGGGANIPTFSDLYKATE